ncbi:EVE domain-containing protein [Pseudarthrobacter sp. S9]|uniref:EVE domain-containing protein n=1 Tax=Pseudarthrobacter sp. S9 TaxID=3418421 RepID=UPI003D025C2A
MKAWLGVVSAEHVQRAVELGIAQIGHGKRGGLARMQEGDALIYYSPSRRLGESTPLRQFTAVGTIADDVIWQVIPPASKGSFTPYRRRVRYEGSRPVQLDAVKDRLRLTSTPNWGYQLRRGLVELTLDDAAIIRSAMCGTGLCMPELHGTGLCGAALRGGGILGKLDA